MALSLSEHRLYPNRMISTARIELPPTRREPDYNLPQSAMALAIRSVGEQLGR
jgi:hypothetical protein